MFLGGLPTPVLQQFKALLEGMATDLVYVCCSGSFRSERVVHLHNRAAEIYSNDVSFYSCVLGGWLADSPVPYRLTGELEPLEALLAEQHPDPLGRAAGVVLALELSRWAGGSTNAYKAAHFRHLMGRAGELVVTQRAKLAAAFGDLRLAGFQARDWLAHLEEGIAAGATLVAFPPFFKGDYEHMYRWLDGHAEWAAPTYPLYDPARPGEVADRLARSHAPYVFISDRRLEGHEPVGEAQFPNKVPHWLYASPGAKPTVVRVRPPLCPFAFKTLDPWRLRPDSRVTIVPAAGPDAFYVRQIFVKKSIKLSSARHNFFVYLDDMLAGVLAYEPAETSSTKVKRYDQMYLLSDLATTRDRRVSKLIVRLSLNETVLRTLAARRLEPVRYVTTTAFSDQPVSMKYRGVYEVLGRRAAPPQMGGWQLQYGADLIAETPQEAYDWWWTNHANPKERGPGGTPGGRGGRGARGRGQLAPAGD